MSPRYFVRLVFFSSAVGCVALRDALGKLVPCTACLPFLYHSVTNLLRPLIGHCLLLTSEYRGLLMRLRPCVVWIPERVKGGYILHLMACTSREETAAYPDFGHDLLVARRLLHHSHHSLVYVE